MGFSRGSHELNMMYTEFVFGSPFSVSVGPAKVSTSLVALHSVRMERRYGL